MSFTLNDGQQNDDDEEEEGDVEDDAVNLILITRRILDLIADAAARPHAHVHVEHVALQAPHTHNQLCIYTSKDKNKQKFNSKRGFKYRLWVITILKLAKHY